MSAHTPKHSVSVAGIVINGDRALAIKRRDNGHWEPPGGVLELDEGPTAGTAREVLEETGVIADVGDMTGLYKNLERGIVALVFRCTLADGEPQPTDESVDVRWLDRSEVTELVAPAYACRFLDAMDYAGSVSVRCHDGRQLVSDVR